MHTSHLQPRLNWTQGCGGSRCKHKGHLEHSRHATKKASRPVSHLGTDDAGGSPRHAGAAAPARCRQRRQRARCGTRCRQLRPAIGGGPPHATRASLPRPRWRPCLHMYRAVGLRLGCCSSRWSIVPGCCSAMEATGPSDMCKANHQAVVQAPGKWAPTGRPKDDEWQTPGAEVCQVVFERFHIAAEQAVEPKKASCRRVAMTKQGQKRIASF